MLFSEPCRRCSLERSLIDVTLFLTLVRARVLVCVAAVTFVCASPLRPSPSGLAPSVPSPLGSSRCRTDRRPITPAPLLTIQMDTSLVLEGGHTSWRAEGGQRHAHAQWTVDTACPCHVASRRVASPSSLSPDHCTPFEPMRPGLTCGAESRHTERVRSSHWNADPVSRFDWRVVTHSLTHPLLSCAHSAAAAKHSLTRVRRSYPAMRRSALGTLCLCATAALLALGVAAPAAAMRPSHPDEVTDLPGLSFKPTFRHYSGYIPLPNSPKMFQSEKMDNEAAQCGPLRGPQGSPVHRCSFLSVAL